MEEGVVDERQSSGGQSSKRQSDEHLSGRADAPAWERRPGEPNIWYTRFEVFRLLGPARSVRAAYRQYAQLYGSRRTHPHCGWYTASREWAWHARAEAWDRWEREQLRKREAEERLHAHRKRLGMLDVMLTVMYTSMMRAEFDQLKKEEARAQMPTIRMFFKDLLNEQRKELGMPVIDEEEDGQVASFTADELAAAQRELAEWQRQEAQAREERENDREDGKDAGGDGD